MKTINFANLPKREKNSKFAMEKLTATSNQVWPDGTEKV